MPTISIRLISIVKFSLALVTATQMSTLAADFETAANAYRSRDYVTAYNKFLPLAKSGDPRAQTVIGMMYKYGESVQQSHEESFRWYLAAAEQGYAPAQFNLGEMCSAGFGVEEDREQAIRWFTSAAELGYQRANDRLLELNVALVNPVNSSDEIIPWSKNWNFTLPVKANPALAGYTEYRVQLGAMTSLASANRLWNLIQGANSDLFATLEPSFDRSDRETGIVYRLQTGPFNTLADAKTFCAELESRGVQSGCLPLKSVVD